MTYSNCKYILWISQEGEPNSARTIPAHDGGLTSTSILQESLYCSGEAPKEGDRITNHKTDDEGYGWSQWGDWIVDRVESYPANIPSYQEYGEIVLCLCKYSPIDASWTRQDKGIVSVDSFGCDAEGLAAFDKWYAETKGTPEFEKYRVKVPRTDGFYQDDDGTYQPGSLNFTPEQFDRLGKGFKSLANSSS